MKTSKNYLRYNIISKTILTISSFFLSIFLFAQDKKIDVDINTNSGGGFLSSPWVWVLGAAIFILLLVALLRGGDAKMHN